MAPFWLQQLPISFLFLIITIYWGNAAEPQVPCFFIFGDSLSDNGNNNNLATLGKANYLPYGIDFPEGPTGRFCNGPNIQDFIVKLLGFNDYIPPFAKVNGTDESILQGVNYASGSAGIRDETGQKLGERIPLNQQLINHKTIISRITGELGNSSAGKLLSRCIYSLQIGSNDYNNNYFQPDFYNTSRQYTPKQYAAVLVQQYSMQIKSLYNDGARKFAVYGLEPIGCSPNAIQNFGTNGSLCVDKINIAAGFFNERLRQLVGELNKNLTDAKFTYLNPFPNLLDIALSGIINVREPCCKTGGEQIPQLCVPNTVPCNNRNQYLFWDRIHPTEAWSCLTARTAYQSLSPTVAYPFNIQQLAKE